MLTIISCFMASIFTLHSCLIFTAITLLQVDEVPCIGTTFRRFISALAIREMGSTTWWDGLLCCLHNWCVLTKTLGSFGN